MITPSDLRRGVEPVPTDAVGIVPEMIRLRLLDVDADIDVVAAEINLGPGALQRRLSDDGIVFRALASQLRAERALELMRQSDAPVAAIAAELRDSSTSHFSRAFPKTVGENPSDIRRRTEH